MKVFPPPKKLIELDVGSAKECQQCDQMAKLY